MKNELYSLGYGHTKRAKIYMAKLTYFVLRDHKATRITIFTKTIL